MTTPRSVPVTIRSATYEANILPGRGMLIQQIVHRPTARPLLWHRSLPDDDLDFTDDMGPPGERSVLGFDEHMLTGGWFVMAPTAGMPFPVDDARTDGLARTWMHGEAARIPWQVTSRAAHEVDAWCTLPSSALAIRRRVSVHDNGVSVATMLTNPGSRARPITIGEHPCFAAALVSGGVIEASVVAAAAPHEPGIDPMTLLNVSDRPDSDARHLCLALDAPGVSVVTDIGRLSMSWTEGVFSNMVVWHHVSPSRSSLTGATVALEPMSAPGLGLDDVELASVRHLLPGEGISWRVSLTWSPSDAETSRDSHAK